MIPTFWHMGRLAAVRDDLIVAPRFSKALIAVSPIVKW